jgi:predicted amidophosphoribosyltransferase
MSGGGKMSCVECGANITMSGAVLCRICDPDMDLILNGQRPKTPPLCDKCMREHMKAHEYANRKSKKASHKPTHRTLPPP